jgi:hypothetical protein
MDAHGQTVIADKKWHTDADEPIGRGGRAANGA